MLKNNSFAAIVDVMGCLVLAECIPPHGKIDLMTRVRGRVYSGGITIPRVSQHFTALLKGNALSQELFRSHVSRWLSDILTRMDVSEEEVEQDAQVGGRVPPGHLFSIDDHQVVVAPGSACDNHGHEYPTINMRTFSEENQMLISRKQSFSSCEAGYLERDSLLDQLHRKNSITPVYGLWEDIYCDIVDMRAEEIWSNSVRDHGQV